MIPRAWGEQRKRTRSANSRAGIHTLTRAHEQHRAGREVVRLIRQIQARTLELKVLGERRGAPELRARERELERLRWRLAVAARRAAADA